ncbi:MAG: hypothetical protein H0X24_08050 [Ktedonobacterales bacterium]|nr:hypothetical protein [Ktedonobacterales bacterium]
MVPPHCTHSGLLAEDWLDLQALAGGKFLPSAARSAPGPFSLRNWAVEVTNMLGWQAVERLTARGLVSVVGPQSNFVKLTETGAAQMAEAMHHAQRLGLTRASVPATPEPRAVHLV